MKIKLILLFMVVSVLAKAQLNFSIKEMNDYNINTNMPENTITEGVEDGPFIDGIFIFKNNTDSMVIFSPSKSEIRVLYRIVKEV